ncbi:hypothetical protein BCR32DRAFT_243011 [Anaeromyces robustus]|uniref:Uncharacterized protein n=1 Tax=Anaeromyces robustus TaxID=1754192 RepID=A0A1Y1XDU1_9FUNG|nr:hypothetical protein BCR32DRAFT_243011 [Anaeromyces robustus]|eukprot:ORX83877.1 hypothetical protein BCR32DRAFT_243011 [Anaeromyces robustus]
MVNSIEVASTLTHNSITKSETDSDNNSLEVAVSLIHSEYSTSTDDKRCVNVEANIHGITEDDTHTITNTTIKNEEFNRNEYKESSVTNEYSFLTKNDYNRYNDFISQKDYYENYNKKSNSKNGKDKIKKPLVYAILLCNEELRFPYIYIIYLNMNNQNMIILWLIHIMIIYYHVKH